MNGQTCRRLYMRIPDAMPFSTLQVVHGKKSCAETVYASELVKSGVYF